MRAVELTRFGPPEVLTPAELPRPVPGPGQVLLRTESIGVNFRDTWVRAGTVPPPPGTSLPLVPGSEVGGVVIGLGDGVSPDYYGRRVVTGTGGSGGYAEYVLARAEDGVSVPDGIDIDEATALFVNGRVALGAFRAAEITSRDRVLILGVSGGVGSLLTQLASQAGASTIIGANRTRARALPAERHGATHSLGYDAYDFDTRLGKIAPEGVDVVFDGIGGHTSETAFEHLRTGAGRLVAYGFASGTPLSVSSSSLIPRGVSILGIGGRARLPGVQKELATEAIELLAAGTLRPVIGQRLPLSAAREAHHGIEERATSGKSLLYPDNRRG